MNMSILSRHDISLTGVCISAFTSSSLYFVTDRICLNSKSMLQKCDASHLHGTCMVKYQGCSTRRWNVFVVRGKVRLSCPCALTEHHAMKT